MTKSELKSKIASLESELAQAREELERAERSRYPEAETEGLVLNPDGGIEKTHFRHMWRCEFDRGLWSTNRAELELHDMLRRFAKKYRSETMPVPENCYFYVRDRGTDCVNWDDLVFDVALFLVGNCFPTKEEAEAALPEWQAILEKVKEVYG